MVYNYIINEIQERLTDLKNERNKLEKKREKADNKHAYKLLCKIYRDKHHENLLNSTIKKYGKTAGSIE